MYMYAHTHINLYIDGLPSKSVSMEGREREKKKKTKKEELGFISLKKVILLSCWRPGSPAFAFTLGKELQRD